MPANQCRTICQHEQIGRQSSRVYDTFKGSIFGCFSFRVYVWGNDTPFQFQYTYVNNEKKRSLLPAGLPRRFDNAELMAKKLEEEFS